MKAAAPVLAGSFADPDVGDTHTVVISWGDGRPDTTVNLAGGVKSIPAQNHQYLDNGSYTITATVTDAGGEDTEDTQAITANTLRHSRRLAMEAELTEVAPVLSDVHRPERPRYQ